MATENITRGVLIVASEEIGENAARHLGEVPFVRAKAVTGPRAALGAIGGLAPHILVFEAGRVPVPAMQAVKNMAELAASRPVPLLMVAGPLDEAVDALRESLGISEVFDAPFDAGPLCEAVKAQIEKWEEARRESQLRKQKQMQIKERLRSASNKYMAMSEEAAKLQLGKGDEEQPDEKPVQDFASDDAAPPAEKDPTKPPDEPTWDGSKSV